MHIVLLILKIIGIALLVLLALVLLLLLLIVFVPFYYRAEGSYYENKPYVKFRVRYLFPLLQLYVKYCEGTPEGKVKLFGITVYDIFSTKTQPSETDSKEKTKADVQEEEKAPPKKTEVPDDRDLKIQELSEEEPALASQEEEPELSFGEKIKQFIAFLIEKIRAILDKLKEIKEKGLQFKAKAENISRQIKRYYEVWQMDVTKAAFQKAKRALLKLWKSLRPRKGNVRFHFGTGDPGSTGQICGIFGMIYPFVGKYVMIDPDFEKQIYEGEFYFKGYITVFMLLKVVWLVLFDKDLKTLRKILMNLSKEETHEQ